MQPRKILLRNFQSPGDVLMLTAAVRDMKRGWAGEVAIDVRTSAAELWENNPSLTSLSEAGAEAIDCEYPAIHESNRHPGHFVGAFHAFLSERMGIEVKLTEFKGDVHLSQEEREVPLPQLAALGGRPYWIVSAGGKRDFTIKWWETRRYQEVVDHFQGRVAFVQVGAPGHFHPKLEGALDLRGQTSIRELIRLVHWSSGVLTPVSFLMHLAAAVEVKPELALQTSNAPFDRLRAFGNSSPTSRPCVVVAGGREPPHWEAYPTHQFIHTVGALACCRTGGCWRSRTLPLGDGSEHDAPRQLCVDVVNGLPRCMDMISAADVIRRIEMYLEGDTQKPKAAENVVAATVRAPHEAAARPADTVLTEASAKEAMDGAIESMIAYPTGRFGGRGIVICAGGPTYTACAWVCIQMLRRAGCTLPIQLWHRGDEELPAQVRALFTPLNVECIDAIRMSRRYPVRRLGGWELKAYALLNSPFEDVLLLDADNVPLIDPERLFDTEQFARDGAILWPDLGRLAKDDPIWDICGIPQRDEPEVESGQLLLNKQRCWRALSLALWMNEHSDFFYKHLHGDKETFHLAFRRLNQRYQMPAKVPRILKGALLQHDFEGKVIFQHRGAAKWSAVDENPRFPGFKCEATCLGFLNKLKAEPAWQQFAEKHAPAPRPAMPARINRRSSARRVILRAPINAYTGYGLHACQICADFQAAGIEVVVRPTAVDERFAPIPSSVRALFDSNSRGEAGEWELLLHPPHFTPAAGAQTVYFTMWESTRLPKSAVKKLNMAALIVVPSKWNAECFRDSGVIRPIKIVPLGIKADIFHPSPLRMDGPCIFGTAGRLADSDPHRKRVDMVVDLFQKTFPREKDVELRIKVFPDCIVPAVSDPRISYIRRYMTETELAGWFSELTCFVSGARAEGWGLMQHQALATGRPLIGTCYGGVAEYFASKMGYVVPFREVPAKGSFAGCGRWAEPDEAEMIAAMKQVYANRKEACARGAWAARKIASLSWSHASSELLGVLETAGMFQ